MKEIEAYKIPELEAKPPKTNVSLREILEKVLYYTLKYTGKLFIMLCQTIFFGVLFLFPVVYIYGYITNQYNADDDTFFAISCIWVFVLYGAVISVFVGELYEYLNKKYGNHADGKHADGVDGTDGNQ